MEDARGISPASSRPASAPQNRGEPGAAVSAWLGIDGGCPEMSTMELVEWVKSLPPGKIPEETKKSIARALISEQIVGKRSDEIVNTNTGWSDIGLHDKSQQAS